MKNKLLVLISCFGISAIIWLATTLSEQHEYQFESVPYLSEVPEGLAPTGSLPEKVKIKVKSTGWKLLSFLGTSSPDLFIPLDKNSTFQRVNLKRSVRENGWFSADMNLISIDPEEIDILLDKRITKRVPVGVRSELTFKPGYGLSKRVYSIPDSVTLSGSYRVLSRLDTAFTEYIKLDGLSELTEIEAVFGGRYSDVQPSEVKIIFDVQQIVEKEFKFHKIEIKDLPPDRDILLIPEGVSLILRGGINELAELDTSVIKVYVNYSEILNSETDMVVPKTDLPPNYDFVSFIPEKIKFIIKKF